MAVRLFRDRSGFPLRVVDYQGYLIQPLPGTGPRLDALANLSPWADDMLVTGYPKSGNHWVWEICHRLRTNNLGAVTSALGDFMLEARDESYLNAQDFPRVLFTHLPPNMVTRTKQLFNGRHKIVYVLRDPKDVAVSYYKQTYSFHLQYEYDGDWKDYLELFLDGKVDSGSWFEHVLSWERYKEEHPELPIHVVFYENLSQDLMGEIRKLAAFLEVEKDEAFFKKLFDVSVFPAMKKNHDDHAPPELKALYRDGDLTMFRKGVVGDWKNVFTVDQSDRLDAIFAERMKSSKLVLPFKYYKNKNNSNKS